VHGYTQVELQRPAYLCVAWSVRQAVQKINTTVDLLISDLHIIKQTIKSPISEAGTITTAGSYILTNTIEGSITIAASDVFLDLNGYGIHNESEEGCITV